MAVQLCPACAEQVLQQLADRLDSGEMDQPMDKIVIELLEKPVIANLLKKRDEARKINAWLLALLSRVGTIEVASEEDEALPLAS